LPLERAGLAAPGTRTGNTQVYSEQIAIWCCLGSNGLLASAISRAASCGQRRSAHSVRGGRNGRRDDARARAVPLHIVENQIPPAVGTGVEGHGRVRQVIDTHTVGGVVTVIQPKNLHRPRPPPLSPRMPHPPSFLPLGRAGTPPSLLPGVGTDLQGKVAVATAIGVGSANHGFRGAKDALVCSPERQSNVAVSVPPAVFGTHQCQSNPRIRDPRLPAPQPGPEGQAAGSRRSPVALDGGHDRVKVHVSARDHLPFPVVGRARAPQRE